MDLFFQIAKTPGNMFLIPLAAAEKVHGSIGVWAISLLQSLSVWNSHPAPPKRDAAREPEAWRWKQHICITERRIDTSPAKIASLDKVIEFSF